MNFIQLVQRLQMECGCSGTAIATTVSQTGEPGRLVSWINTAWMDIQSAHPDWNFMRQGFTFNSVAQQQSYTAAQAGASDMEDWKVDSLRLYLTSMGVSNEMIFPFCDYDEFRNLFMFGSMRTSYQRPVLFTVDPSKNLLLGAAPDDIYTINGEYYVTPSEMTLDANTPRLPTAYHMAIVYRAMMSYGAYEAAPEVLGRGEKEFTKMMFRLENDQLPDITFGPPLA